MLLAMHMENLAYAKALLGLRAIERRDVASKRGALDDGQAWDGPLGEVERISQLLARKGGRCIDRSRIDRKARMLVEQSGGKGENWMAQVAKVGADGRGVGASFSKVSAPEVYRSPRHIGLLALGEGKVGVGNIVCDVVVF